MARMEMPDIYYRPDSGKRRRCIADTMFELGMMYASGRSVPADLVTAHKWFNLAAAMRATRKPSGCAARSPPKCRMPQIGQAQRAARDWLKAHPEPAAQASWTSARRPEAEFPGSTYRAGFGARGRLNSPQRVSALRQGSTVVDLAGRATERWPSG